MRRAHSRHINGSGNGEMKQTHGYTKAEREAEIAKLENLYPRRFLEQSLHGDAMWWRTLTAKSTIEGDKPETKAHSR